MLITQSFQHPLGRVALLAVPSPILGKPGIDDLGEPIQLGPIDRGLAPVSRRNRKTQHLPDAVTRNPEMQCRRSRTHAVSTGQTDFPVKFHGENTPALPGVRKGKSGRLLRRPQPDHPAATVDEFCTAVLSVTTGRLRLSSGPIHCLGSEQAISKDFGVIE